MVQHGIPPRQNNCTTVTYRPKTRGLPQHSPKSNLTQLANKALRAIFFSCLVTSAYSLPAQADCWDEAGRIFTISPDLLYAIAQQESGLKITAMNRNKDGSRDIGLMQINSRHLPRLQSMGIDERTLVADGCLSIMVGASILADFMKRYGYSWEAVGAYNAGTAASNQAQRMKYAKQVWQRYRLLRSQQLSSNP